ncbi:rCG55845 [Rattus norvegicus]|uniref:RCG55845 n=1 Tax=Rattus norvegicus TaxID=10116 RepID=A6JLP5_RAT|nr:rCG55845 [Rattus norvegicus]
MNWSCAEFPPYNYEVGRSHVACVLDNSFPRTLEKIESRKWKMGVSKGNKSIDGK